MTGPCEPRINNQCKVTLKLLGKKIRKKEEEEEEKKIRKRKAIYYVKIKVSDERSAVSDGGQTWTLELRIVLGGPRVFHHINSEKHWNSTLGR